LKVLFIYTRELPQSPSKPLVDFEAINFGISSISSFIKNQGHETRLLVMTRKSDFSIIDEFMKDYSPQLICFTAVASEYLFVERIGKYIEERYPDKFLLIGGVHVSLVPDDSMLDTFNALCVGEGEEPTLELIEQLGKNISPSGISNLWIKRDTEIEKNPPRPFISDLDALPFPDRQMWDEWTDMDMSGKRPSLLLGRGCPFNCTYCCNHSFKRLAEGPYVRFRSSENIVREIESVISRYPLVKEFYFEVETFGANLEWALELCSGLESLNKGRDSPLTFGVNLRITPTLSNKMEALFQALKSSNFRFVNIGLESGSERVRREVLKRRYSNEDVIEAVRLARRYGLEVSFYNLLGLLYETVDDFNETIKVNRVCLPDNYNLSIFYPYPGTEIYDLCKEKGFLPPDLLSTDKERIEAALEFPDFSKRHIQKAFIWFDYYVYQGHRPNEELVNRLLYNYLRVYGRQNKIQIFYLILRDVINPSLRFNKEYRELI
jgi:radical SAM superfamily enzyme YgiQ (UPF0313 family)